MAKGNNRKKQRRRSAFYDLNVTTEGVSQAERVAVIITALQLGYSGVAFNHVVKGSPSDGHRCKGRSIDLSAITSAHPEMAQSAHFHRDILGVPSQSRTFRQYDRLTLIMDTTIQTSAVTAANPVLRSYDIVAVRPTCQKVFDQACTNLEVDLISLDLIQRMPFRFKASSIQAAVERGVFFEITFSEAFQDVKARRELFANAQMLQGLTRGRNMIITSGAGRSMDVRGPNDVANMATLFGLSREAAKLSVSKNCEDVITRGLTRKRAYKSAVLVEKLPAWEISGSDGTWFEVPKAWDPMSNARAESEFRLPEKSLESPPILEAVVDNLQNTEDFMNDPQIVIQHSPIQAIDLEGSLDQASKEEGFLSINLAESKFEGGPKREKQGLARKEKHLGKFKKRKR